jgi:hypothetical protein
MNFSPRALGLCATVVMLAGCGGAQTGMGAAVPQGATAQSQAHRASGSSGLIYANEYAGPVNIYTYPQGQYVAQFDPPNFVQGMCADNKGDVFLTTPGASEYQGYVYEYAYGATTPSQHLVESGWWDPVACSWDPSTGNLAVANDSMHSPSANIAIFSDAQGSPTFFNLPNSYSASSIAYDNQGNLFTRGNEANPPHLHYAELPLGRETVRYITIKHNWDALEIQSDGTYMTGLGSATERRNSNPYVARMTCKGTKAKIIGQTNFSGFGKHAGGAYWISGNGVVIPMGIVSGNLTFGVFPYPQGGGPEATVTGFPIYRVTVAVALSNSHIRK